MKNQGRKYRDIAQKNRAVMQAEWKKDLLLDYKLRRVQVGYGIEGLKAFERDKFSCAICGEWDIRVLQMHELCKPFISASNLLTLCSNCHSKNDFPQW